MVPYPSMKWERLKRIVERDPLNYRTTRRAGSHRTMEADGRPIIHVAFHEGHEMSGRAVRKILVTDVGLSDEEARGLL
jgi:predicted RNA binding protein YcfA (HicA-like mRNA interferase family)